MKLKSRLLKILISNVKELRKQVFFIHLRGSLRDDKNSLMTFSFNQTKSYSHR